MSGGGVGDKLLGDKGDDSRSLRKVCPAVGAAGF